MRAIVSALGLIAILMGALAGGAVLMAAPAAAQVAATQGPVSQAPADPARFAVEEERVYPGTSERVVSVLSNTDLDVFDPFVRLFQQRHPDIGVRYVTVSSATVHRVIASGAAFDVAISSAMDLQFLLANDGFAQPHRSAATAGLPGWARWRDTLFGFAVEPAVAVVSRALWGDLPRPRTRQELIALMRDHPGLFQDAIGTYDIRTAGLGYLFATQESRNSDTFWRLSDLMGRLGVRLYCCSSQMIDAVARGDLAMAYNVLGSYTGGQLAADDRVEVLPLQDYGTIMLRTVLIPEAAPNAQDARLFVDLLLRQGMRARQGEWDLPPLSVLDQPGASAYGPIRLGPALLVFLDRLNRHAFIDEWLDAVAP